MVSHTAWRRAGWVELKVCLPERSHLERGHPRPPASSHTDVPVNQSAREHLGVRRGKVGGSRFLSTECGSCDSNTKRDTPHRFPTGPETLLSPPRPEGLTAFKKLGSRFLLGW